MAIAKSVFQNVATEDLWWQSYVATNTAIADRIVDAYRAGDIVLCAAALFLPTRSTG